MNTVTTQRAAAEEVTPAQPIVVRGTVVRGDQRGRELGFPTANVPTPSTRILDGVYSGLITVGSADQERRFVTVVSIGHRPTYYGREGVRLLEAHLLDFAGSLYDAEVTLELHVRIRLQRKFSGSDALVEQMRLDTEATRAWARVNGFSALLGAHGGRGRLVPTVAR